MSAFRSQSTGSRVTTKVKHSRTYVWLVLVFGWMTNDRLGIRVFRKRRAIARVRLLTRLTRWRRAIYRSPEILATVHDDWQFKWMFPLYLSCCVLWVFICAYVCCVINKTIFSLITVLTFTSISGTLLNSDNSEFGESDRSPGAFQGSYS